MAQKKRKEYEPREWGHYKDGIIGGFVLFGIVAIGKGLVWVFHHFFK